MVVRERWLGHRLVDKVVLEGGEEVLLEARYSARALGRVYDTKPCELRIYTGAQTLVYRLV